MDQGKKSLICIGKFHASIVIRDDIYIFGGLTQNKSGDCIFNDKFMKIGLSDIEVIKTYINNVPSGRCGHCLNRLNENNIVLFGGCVNDESYNDLWIYNTKENRWKLIEVEVKPKPRSFHYSCIWENKLIVYGGKEIIDENEALWYYDFTLNLWTRIKAKRDNLIGLRYGISGCLYNNKIFIFGGMNTKKKIKDSKVLTLDLSKWEWKIVKKIDKTVSTRVFGASFVNDSKWVISGGINNVKKCSDALQFDLKSYCWKKLNYLEFTRPVYGHSICKVDLHQKLGMLNIFVADSAGFGTNVIELKIINDAVDSLDEYIIRCNLSNMLFDLTYETNKTNNMLKEKVYAQSESLSFANRKIEELTERNILAKNQELSVKNKFICLLREMYSFIECFDNFDIDSSYNWHEILQSFDKIKIYLKHNNSKLFSSTPGSKRLDPPLQNENLPHDSNNNLIDKKKKISTLYNQLFEDEQPSKKKKIIFYDKKVVCGDGIIKLD